MHRCRSAELARGLEPPGKAALTPSLRRVSAADMYAALNGLSAARTSSLWASSMVVPMPLTWPCSCTTYSQGHQTRLASANLLTYQEQSIQKNASRPSRWQQVHLVSPACKDPHLVD